MLWIQKKKLHFIIWIDLLVLSNWCYKKKNVLTSNNEFESLIISLYSCICIVYIEYIVSFKLLREIYLFISNNKSIVGSIIFFQ